MLSYSVYLSHESTAETCSQASNVCLRHSAWVLWGLRSLEQSLSPLLRLGGAAARSRWQMGRTAAAIFVVIPMVAVAISSRQPRRTACESCRNRHGVLVATMRVNDGGKPRQVALMRGALEHRSPQPPWPLGLEAAVEVTLGTDKGKSAAAGGTSACRLHEGRGGTLRLTFQRPHAAARLSIDPC